MVEIQLDSKFKITSDQNQWVLCKRSGKSWKMLCYSTKLSSCINEYYNISLRLSSVKSFDELIIISKELRKHIEDTLKPFETYSDKDS